jgi:hypothetical protein
MTIKKEWFDKIKMEADQSYSMPLLAFKFLGARRSDGVQYILALDFQTFCDIINYVTNLKHELDLVYDKKEI